MQNDNYKKIKQKKLLCFNKKNGAECRWGNDCTYAHSIIEQKIDTHRLSLYHLILGRADLSNISKDEYSQLFLFTNKCDKCFTDLCSGGLNCKHGASCAELKICKNDFIGICNEETEEYVCTNNVWQTHEQIEIDDIKFSSCKNGQHLSTRNLKRYPIFGQQVEFTRNFNEMSGFFNYLPDVKI